MNTVFHNFYLDLNDIHSGIFLGVKTGDTGHAISVALRTGFEPYDIAEGTSATLKAKSPSGTTSSTACTIVDNCIECAIGSDITGSVGMVECEISLSGDGKTITTPTFVVVVESKL